MNTERILAPRTFANAAAFEKVITDTGVADVRAHDFRAFDFICYSCLACIGDCEGEGEGFS
jgi:hypothetical protein